MALVLAPSHTHEKNDGNKDLWKQNV